jgi:hypothetical protein
MGIVLVLDQIVGDESGGVDAGADVIDAKPKVW